MRIWKPSVALRIAGKRPLDFRHMHTFGGFYTTAWWTSSPSHQPAIPPAQLALVLKESFARLWLPNVAAWPRDGSGGSVPTSASQSLISEDQIHQDLLAWRRGGQIRMQTF